MKDKYISRCHICFDITEVKYLEIYHIGSEGLEICWSCERDLIRYIGEKKTEFQKERKIEYMKKKYPSTIFKGENK